MFRVLVTASATAGLLMTLQGTALARHAWNGYHWERTTTTGEPIELNVIGNLTAAWTGGDPAGVNYLTYSIPLWNQFSEIQSTVLVPADLSTVDRQTCAPTAGQVEVCNADYGATGWLGIATIWLKGKHITEGTAQVNDHYFSMSQYNDAGWKKLVMCQEVAHTFGLGHQDTNFYNPNKGSCMDYTAFPYGPPDNTAPNAHDYEQLTSIYGHIDGATTTKPRKGNNANGLTASEWGRAVAFNSRGMGVRFVRDLGGGIRRVTHVLWTLEASPEDHDH